MAFIRYYVPMVIIICEYTYINSENRKIGVPIRPISQNKGTFILLFCYFRKIEPSILQKKKNRIGFGCPFAWILPVRLCSGRS